MAEVKKKPKIGVVVFMLLLIAGAGLAYWFFFLKPALAGIGEVRGANTALEQDIAALKQKLSQKSEIEKKWKEISGQEAHLLSRIPQTADLPQVLGALESLVQSSGLSIDSFSAGGIQEGEGYQYIPVSLRMSGGETELMRLLEKLEKFTHMTLTERATIEAGGDSSRLSVDFKLVFSPEGRVETVGPKEDQE